MGPPVIFIVGTIVTLLVAGFVVLSIVAMQADEHSD